MKDVELIRASALRNLSTALDRIRIHASGIPGNIEAVDTLRGDAQRKILVRLAEVLMRHMGHITAIEETAGSKTARAANRILGRS
jgi:uncharacterized sporulation protein YeaH/YhbH (DUF444 family)